MTDLSGLTLNNLRYMARALSRGITQTDPAIFGQQVAEMKRDLRAVHEEIARRSNEETQ